MTIFKWLYPGLGIKRWLGVTFFGVFIAVEGLAIAQCADFTKPVLDIVRNYMMSISDLTTGMMLILVGLIIMGLGFRNFMGNILTGLLPGNDLKLGDILVQKVQLKKGPKIVAIGGGTGLSTLLRGLKEVTGNITAIVTVSDDGGSSGRLRGDLGMLAPGDIRNCLVALADTENAMEELFNYRFPRESELAGHSLGNLLLAGLTQTTGNFAQAVQEASRVLAIRGKVLPGTICDIELKAEMHDGRIVRGETKMVADQGQIKRAFLHPENCTALQASIDAILGAEAIILGPGSLYTSVIPNLLISGIVDAIKESKATVYYVCNIMTQPGETDGYKVSQHIKAIEEHCGSNIIDKVIVNKAEISQKLQRKYKKEGAIPVIYDSSAVNKFSVQVIESSLISQSDLARHDSAKLVKVFINDIFHERMNNFYSNLFGRNS